jgi:CubicO group peptidase (beta-lactamase class C family)
METVSPEEVGFSAARLHRIDDALRRFIDNGTIAGAVTLVARQGKIAHFQAAGLMDREAGRPMARDAIFRIQSMTKPITATAAMILFEEGHFLLDDPIAEYLPEFAQTKVFVRDTTQGMEVAELERPVTIRHLLTHTSGLTYRLYEDDPVAALYRHETTPWPAPTSSASASLFTREREWLDYRRALCHNCHGSGCAYGGTICSYRCDQVRRGAHGHRRAH